MPRGLRACRMLDVSFLEFPADTGQTTSGPKSDTRNFKADDRCWRIPVKLSLCQLNFSLFYTAISL